MVNLPESEVAVPGDVKLPVPRSERLETAVRLNWFADIAQKSEVRGPRACSHFVLPVSCAHSKAIHCTETVGLATREHSTGRIRNLENCIVLIC